MNTIAEYAVGPLCATKTAPACLGMGSTRPLEVIKDPLSPVSCQV